MLYSDNDSSNNDLPNFIVFYPNENGFHKDGDTAYQKLDHLCNHKYNCGFYLLT